MATPKRKVSKTRRDKRTSDIARRDLEVREPRQIAVQSFKVAWIALLLACLSQPFQSR